MTRFKFYNLLKNKSILQQENREASVFRKTNQEKGIEFQKKKLSWSLKKYKGLFIHIYKPKGSEDHSVFF